ncbi:MAG: hypothetical protein WEA31_06070 [Pirellulales bacterium]
MMVATANQFAAGEIHFSALVQPIAECEWWARTHDANSPIHSLALERQLLVDRTWNEFGQHSNPLTVDELRSRIADDLGDL